MMQNYNVFQQLAPYAEKLEQSDSFYGIRMGHYCNNRQVGYIELDFDFKKIEQFDRKMNDIKRLLGPDSPFRIYYQNTYDREENRTFCVIHLFLGYDYELEEELIHNGWNSKTPGATSLINQDPS